LTAAGKPVVDHRTLLAAAVEQWHTTAAPRDTHIPSGFIMTTDLETPELAEVLDAYLRRLQRGEQAGREELVQKHPELASYLDCVEALDRLSSQIGGTAGEPGGESPEEPPIRDFGSYELLEEIGRGGMGVVYKARQKGLERIVAMKMILASHLASAEHVRRFQAEARAAARLRHANIVPIHEVGQCHGQHYFTMEYIDGPSLAHRMAEGPIERAALVRMLALIARAVHHLHENGIVHRDLKPANLLLDSQGSPYVSDFGLAKFLAADAQTTTTNAIAGTLCYMAPEQAAGESDKIGPATDIYSLGVVLYEMLAGRPPFREANPRDTWSAILAGEAPPPREFNREIPRELEWVCMKCLARNPADRYPSAAALAEDLERYLKREVLVARPPGLFERVWGWVRREPALAARVGTFAAFFAANQLNLLSEGPADKVFYQQMSAVIALWALIAVVFQQFLKSQRWTLTARLGWGLLDSAMLLVVLLLANGVASPLVVGYFLLVVGSGLWNRVRFVWLMTGLSLASYGFLIFDYYQQRSPEFRAAHPMGLSHFAVFLVAMTATALAVAYLVSRLRALSNYFGQKLP
jgi:serine/threonine-protein kinase